MRVSGENIVIIHISKSGKSSVKETG